MAVQSSVVFLMLPNFFDVFAIYTLHFVIFSFTVSLIFLLVSILVVKKTCFLLILRYKSDLQNFTLILRIV